MSTVTIKKSESDTQPLSDAELADVRNKITRAKTQFVLQQPFYAALILQRPLIETYAIPSAGADAKGRIYYNPKFIASKSVGTVDRIIFLIAHEVMHIAFHHTHKDVVGERNAHACNVAMDKVINELLIADRVGDFIEGGLRHPGAEKMKWQDLYDDSKQTGGGIGDDLVACPDGEPTGAELEELKERTKIELAQAAQAARMQGKLSGNLARVVDDLLQVRTPWYVILERFMQSFVSSDYSWSRPNRRFIGQGLYLPGVNKTPSMGEVVIGIDTSGSVSESDLAVFSGHLNRIIETCAPSKVTVVYCDADVANVDVFTSDDYPVKLCPHGGGGTDMRKVWEYADEHCSEADCLVLMTDGYTPWPDRVSIPSVVLSVTSKSAPEAIAETVFFNQED